ncbi:MAG: uracil-xanthine permease family protein [Angelakisella sp.]|nr:uracil-xanthine permease family protein [Angelakisella sp.]
MSEKKEVNIGEEGIYDARVLGAPKMLILGIQHVFAMFGATVLVPLITGLNVSTTLLMAGLGTLLFHFITKGKVPAFLGSSFAFLGGFAIVAPKLVDANGQQTIPNTEMLPFACGGVFAAGLVYIVVAGLIHFFGVKKVMKFFPPIVTGPIIISIGLILAPSAINNASTNWLLAVVALSVIIICNIWGKGMIKIIPIILGIAASYIVALLTGAIDFSQIANASYFAPAPITMAKFDVSSVLTIMPIALAAMMEHIGDMAAISATVGKNYIADPGLARTLVGDGLATSLSGFFGGPANTTYGENTGVLALTKVYDPKVVQIAAVVAVLLSFIPKFDAVVNTIPAAIIGGISLILYGMISAIGVRNVVENQVDFTKSRNLIIAAVILVSALGFNAVGGVTIVSTANLTISLSGLAIAAILGIGLNAILPGNDYEFGADLTGDTSANLQL